jgi:GNAT superfamily N-acetyltransferase
VGSAIRKASPSDRASLTGLMVGQLREHGLPVDQTQLRHAIGHVLDHPEDGLFLLASGVEGRPAGAAYLAFIWSLEHAGRVAWLEELYVLPQDRGGGTGAALVRAACAEAGARGCEAVDLEVDAGHERVARLYRREGFRPLSRSRWVRVLR